MRCYNNCAASTRAYNLTSLSHRKLHSRNLIASMPLIGGRVILEINLVRVFNCVRVTKAHDQNQRP